MGCIYFVCSAVATQASIKPSNKNINNKKKKKTKTQNYNSSFMGHSITISLKPYPEWEPTYEKKKKNCMVRQMHR